LDEHKLLDYSLLIGICSVPEMLPDSSFNDVSLYRHAGGGLKIGNKEVMYIGIIDILTKYNMKKRAEHYIIGTFNDRNQISAIPPDKYRIRFVEFFRSIFTTKSEV